LTDIAELRQQLEEVAAAYQAKLAQANDTFLDDVYELATIKASASEQLKRKLEDWWRTPVDERPGVAEVLGAARLSRQRLYQVKKELEARGETVHVARPAKKA
jgi:hypothetical protein